ncbi:MAG: hypothetical protein JEZ06_20455 [Anaerolineaceae bacterium]|nr:hypothetical protein [Anaerolineaceae bacterium]
MKSESHSKQVLMVLAYQAAGTLLRFWIALQLEKLPLDFSIWMVLPEEMRFAEVNS